MYQRIADLLGRYERGEIRRRDLICGVAALAASGAAPARASAPFQGAEVNHVALDVADVKRSRDFYQELLGLPVRREDSRSCFLGLGANFLALFESSNPGLNHYCVGIESYDVERVTAELERQGLNPRQPSGSNRVYFDDPDGIEVQLSSTGHQP